MRTLWWLLTVVAKLAWIPAVVMIFFSTPPDGGLWAIIEANRISATVFACFTVSAAVGAMRNPPDGFYNWFFRFANAMTANLRAELFRQAGQGRRDDNPAPREARDGSAGL
jgi:hypothetical protein